MTSGSKPARETAPPVDEVQRAREPEPDQPHRLVEALNDCVVVDLETTGLDAKHDRIIEIAALRVREGHVTQRFHRLINPERSIPDFVRDLTGISDGLVVNAPRFGEVAGELLNFLHGQRPAFALHDAADPGAHPGQSALPTMVGHNVKFDFSFIQHELIRAQLSGQHPPVLPSADPTHRAPAPPLGDRTDPTRSLEIVNPAEPNAASPGAEEPQAPADGDAASGSEQWLPLPYTPRLLCTAEQSRRLIPRTAVGRYRLANVAGYLHTPHRPLHRAESDAMATLDILRALTKLERREKTAGDQRGLE